MGTAIHNIKHETCKTYNQKHAKTYKHANMHMYIAHILYQCYSKILSSCKWLMSYFLIDSECLLENEISRDFIPAIVKH